MSKTLKTPFDLTEEEQEFEDALTLETFVSVENLEEEKAKAVRYAKNTMRRKQLTIRPYERDIEAIKAI